MTPSDKLFSHYSVKNEGELTSYLKISQHRSTMDSITSTFSSVKPRAIIAHATACCGLGKCQPVLQD